MDRKKLEKIIEKAVDYGWLAFLLGWGYYFESYQAPSMRKSGNDNLPLFELTWLIVFALSIFFFMYVSMFIAKVLLGERHPINAIREDIRQMHDEMERENFQLHD